MGWFSRSRQVGDPTPRDTLISYVRQWVAIARIIISLITSVHTWCIITFQSCLRFWPGSGIYRNSLYIPDPGQKRKQLWNVIVLLKCIRYDNSRYWLIADIAQALALHYFYIVTSLSPLSFWSMGRCVYPCVRVCMPRREIHRRRCSYGAVHCFVKWILTLYIGWLQGRL